MVRFVGSIYLGSKKFKLKNNFEKLLKSYDEKLLEVGISLVFVALRKFLSLYII